MRLQHLVGHLEEGAIGVGIGRGGRNGRVHWSRIDPTAARAGRAPGRCATPAAWAPQWGRDRLPAYPADWEADVLLRNGRPIHLRPITPADGDALRAFHASLSDRTVYFRFFSAKPELTDRT